MYESEKATSVESINKYIEYYKVTLEAMEDDRNTGWDMLEEEFREVIDIFERKS